MDKTNRMTWTIGSTPTIGDPAGSEESGPGPRPVAQGSGLRPDPRARNRTPRSPRKESDLQDPRVRNRTSDSWRQAPGRDHRHRPMPGARVESTVFPVRSSLGRMGVPVEGGFPSDEGLVHEMGGPLPSHDEVPGVASAENVSDTLASHETARSEPCDQCFIRPSRTPSSQ